MRQFCVKANDPGIVFAISHTYTYIYIKNTKDSFKTQIVFGFIKRTGKVSFKLFY